MKCKTSSTPRQFDHVDESYGEKRRRFSVPIRWAIFCLALLLVMGPIVFMPDDLLRRATTVRIDRNGTACLGGMIPLQNRKLCRVALRVASYLNGGKLAVVADKSANASSIVTVLDAIRASSTNSGLQQQFNPPARLR